VTLLLHAVRCATYLALVFNLPASSSFLVIYLYPVKAQHKYNTSYLHYHVPDLTTAWKKKGLGRRVR
jgi:hypothetical protein